MNIQLLGTFVDELSLTKTDNIEDIEKMELSVGQAFSTTNLKEFLVSFDVKIQVEEKHIFVVKYIAKFEADDEISENERESKFFYINAPAIGYPFLRAYVANFMLSSGFAPMIMPTVNFVKLAENKVIPKQELEDKPE